MRAVVLFRKQKEAWDELDQLCKETLSKGFETNMNIGKTIKKKKRIKKQNAETL